MYNNLSSFPLQSPLSSTTSTDAARVSPPSIHHQLFAATNPPVMRSRAAHHHGLPDQPDRAGMRKRRAQFEMTVCKLQRSRGVEQASNSHAEVLEAYGYRQLAQWVMDMPANVMNAVQSMNEALGDAVSFRIGPPGAQGAPARSNPPSVDDFMKKFSANFEITLSPVARNSADMRGMLIVIGEHHTDPSIQGLIKEVMFEFRRIRGDRFFLESGHEDQCEERVEQYQMQRNDCELLEKNSVAFKELEVIEGEMYRGLRDCVSYLKKYVAFAQEDLREERVDTCLDFIKKYEKKLPASKLAAYVDLQTKAQKIKVRFNNLVDNSRSRRDQHMADYVRDNRSATGLNFMVVGASHVNGIANYLQDLPLMLMLPRALVKQAPANKDEL
jgi:hypothetical protein